MDNKKTALILGANSDIAKKLIYIFATNQHNLILAARDTNNLHTLKSDLEIKFNINIKLVKFDILELNNHVNFYNKLQITPDVVVAAIGLLGTQKEAFNNFSFAKKVIDTNLTSQISILDIIAKDMIQKNSNIKKSKKYTIIGISSVAGDRGRPQNHTYGAAKSGFSTYLSGLRATLKRNNINVITIKPGFIETKMTSHMKFPKILKGNPEKVAKDIYKSYVKSKYVIYALLLVFYYDIYQDIARMVIC